MITFREDQTAISVNNKWQFEYTEVRVTFENYSGVGKLPVSEEF